MSLTDTPRFLFPGLQSVYTRGAPYAYAILRITLGVALVTHGWGKIQNPFGAVGMVEGLGFYPGVFWSPLLAGTEFFGGILLALGLLTRPAAIASFIVLLVTVYFHWVVRAEGFAGAEKSIIWSAALLYVVFAGPGHLSVEKALGRQV